MDLRLFYILNFFLFASIASNSQETSEYVFVKRDSIRGVRLFNTIEKEIDEYWNTYNGEFKNEFKDLKKPVKNILRKEYSRIYFHSEYEDYLKKVFSELVRTNLELQNLNVRVYLTRLPIPNAVTYIDGTIFVNIGLFQVLDNEAQLAMILGHELGHWQEQHSRTDFDELHTMLGSDDIQALYREAKKGRGNQRLEKIEKLTRNIDFTGSRHGRLHEEESDSLSLSFLRNTDYNLQEAILGVYNLRQTDTEFFDMNQLLRETFAFADLPFNDKWVYKRQSMGDRMKYILSEEEIDSLKTHPDPEIRYEVLSRQLVNEPPRFEGKKFIVSEDIFQRMKRDFKYQSVDVLLNSNLVSDAFYYILNQQSKGDTSEYLKIALYKCLQIIHAKLSDHTLGRYVATRNPYFSPEYNKLTIFIDNLTLTDLEKLKANYKVKHNLQID